MQVTVEQKSGFEARKEEEMMMSEEVVADWKSGFEAVGHHLVVPEDELEEVYSSGEESYDQWTVEARTEKEMIMSEEVVVDQKNEFEAAGRHLVVPEDELEELYSSGEEFYDQWTVETYKVYKVTKNIEADVTLTRAAAQQTAATTTTTTAATADVDASHGVYSDIFVCLSVCLSCRYCG